MRSVPVVAAFTAVLLISSTASAQEPRAAIQAFGGLGLGNVSSTNATYGGLISGSLTRNIQLLAEGGRIGNVLPSTTQSLIGLSPVGFGVSAWYGEGGVRFTGGSSAARPYVEGAAGIARLRPRVTGIGSGLPSAIANVGLRFFERTAPLATVGGGITFEGGPFIADIGYRHRRVFSDSWMEALALGGTLSTNEVRMGVGVRF
jgi:hypothetical protein